MYKDEGADQLADHADDNSDEDESTDEEDMELENIPDEYYICTEHLAKFDAQCL